MTTPASHVTAEKSEEVGQTAEMRLTAEEVLIVALMDILVFKPVEGHDDSPHQQIAVYARNRSAEALEAWKANTYVPAKAGVHAAPEAELLRLSRFLLDRLDDFERDALQEDDGEYTLRQFGGHVSPAMERLRDALEEAEGRS